jgi:predicted site-specific integrase-resolvase
MENQRILFEAPKLALTRAEAADALGISRATLDRLVKRGLIHPCRATGRPLFAIAELERFLRETTDVINQELQSAAA